MIELYEYCLSLQFPQRLTYIVIIVSAGIDIIQLLTFVEVNIRIIHLGTINPDINRNESQ